MKDQSFISQNWKLIGIFDLERKFDRFAPLGIQIEIDVPHANKIIKLHSFRAFK